MIRGTENQNVEKDSEPSTDKGFIQVAFTTFVTVFLAELGDKTQLATLLLSAHSGRPIIVFCGAALALITTSLVGVLVGRWLSRFIPEEQFNLISGALMLIIGIWLFVQAFSN